MGYITEIGLNSRFFQGKGAYQLVYHKNSGTLPLTWAVKRSTFAVCILKKMEVIENLKPYLQFTWSLKPSCEKLRGKNITETSGWWLW